MRMDGVLTGCLWNRHSSREKVKVKGKSTNASKASGRCSRAKCSLCRQQPVSKARSKAKGRNKRALTRLLAEDEWAFHKRAAASPIKAGLSVPSHVDCNDCRTYDALYASHWDVVDDDAQDVYDACPAEPNALGDEVTDDDPDANDHDSNIADDCSALIMPVHDDAKGVAMSMRAAAHRGDYEIFYHQGFSSDGKLCSVAYPVRVILADNLKKAGLDVNPEICAKATDVIIDDHCDDVNHGCPTALAHKKSDGALEDNEGADEADTNEESHGMMIHAADDVSCDDEDESDFSSMISGLVNVKWPAHNNNQVVLEVESEEDNSLSSDWCYIVASSDAIDDWYLC